MIIRLSSLLDQAFGLCLEHILPCAFSFWLGLLVISSLIEFLAIDQPAVRFYLWHIPLIRSVVSLFTGVHQPALRSTLDVISRARVPERFATARLGLVGVIDGLASPQSFSILAISGLLITAFMLIKRWFAIFCVHRSLVGSPLLDPDTHGELFGLLAEACYRLEVRMPRVVICQSRMPTPFTLGWRRPTIVVSPELIVSGDRSVLRAALGHEVAHIKRRDYAANWTMLITSDLLFFLPGVGRLRDLISREREMMCDALCVERLGCAEELARALERSDDDSTMHPDTIERLALLRRRQPIIKVHPVASLGVALMALTKLLVQLGHPAWRVIF